MGKEMLVKGEGPGRFWKALGIMGGHGERREGNF